VPPLVDPQAVEMNIFADLTNHHLKEAKMVHKADLSIPISPFF
jgi:hypothetical protein